MAGICYSMKKNQLNRSGGNGFLLEEDGTLRTQAGESIHTLYLPPIDGIGQDAPWGRLSFELQAEENMVCYVYALARNEDTFFQDEDEVKISQFLNDPEKSDTMKFALFERMHALRFVGQKDMLLYSIKGRYLYLAIRVLGEGECAIRNIKVDRQGDNFMETFPEIYREENSFFHRFLSVFSSIFHDFQADINDLPALLDLDTCPRELLPVYGKWLGIDISGDFLEEDQERTLVKEAYQLNRIKGTKAAIERICQILLGEEVRVLEQNVMKEYITREESLEFGKLYGTSPYDVTILVQKPVSEALRFQLMFLLNQFRPVRSKIRIVSMDDKGMLDAHSYLDINARVFRQDEANLDEGKAMDGYITLQ